MIERFAFKVQDNVDFEQWQEISDHCEYATFFHSPPWFRAFVDTYPELQIATKRLVFRSGKQVILPLMTVKGARYSKDAVYMASPAGCYGGWISAEALDEEEKAHIVRWIISNCRNLTLRENPFCSSVSSLFAEAESTIKSETTQVLFLDRFSAEEELMLNYKHSVRKQINKGLKAGLVVKKAETWEEWNSYFQIYQEARKRWGASATNNYPLRLFQNLYRLNGDAVKLWLILADRTIVGGNLNFYQSKHCVEWHAVFKEEFFVLGSRNFLVHRIIKDAMDNAYRIYDFNPSGGHTGTENFKKTFGTTELPSNMIVRITKSDRVQSRARSLIRRIKERLR